MHFLFRYSPDWDSELSVRFFPNSAGSPRWFDCKLGTMKDGDLAKLVGIPKSKIRYRRQLFGIDAWQAKMAIEPYRHLLGIESTRTVARLCGVSAHSIDQYRKSLGVKGVVPR